MVVIKTIDKASTLKTFAKVVENYAEIQISKRVCRNQIPHVLEMLDTFEDDANFYIVTKYVPSGNLLNYVVKHWRFTPVPEDTTRVILKQLVSAVKHLHERNIVHRDIKEANVLVTTRSDQLHVLLTDFGIAA